MTITPENLPQLAGPSWKEAKAWFAGLRPHQTGVYVPGWHLDDGFEGAEGVTPKAAKLIAATAKQILVNSHRWHDSSTAYDLCADVRIVAETLWPGFEADVFTSASRTGYVSMRDRELPNFVIEEYGGEFYLLEFTRVGPISECPLFRMSRLEGAEIDISKVEDGDDYIDVSCASVMEGTTREFDDIDEHDDVIQAIHEATTESVRHPGI